VILSLTINLLKALTGAGEIRAQQLAFKSAAAATSKFTQLEDGDWLRAASKSAEKKWNY